MDLVLTGSGVIATALITACVFPQVVTVLRSGELGGVSVTAAALAATSCAGWAAYATMIGMQLAALSSALGATLWATIATIASTRTGARPSGWCGIWAGMLLVCAHVAGLVVLGAVLLAEALTNTVPQAFRARTCIDGASVTTYLMMAGGAMSWVVYGVAAGDAPLALSSALKGTVSLYIVLLVRRSHRSTVT